MRIEFLKGVAVPAFPFGLVGGLPGLVVDALDRSDPKVQAVIENNRDPATSTKVEIWWTAQGDEPKFAVAGAELVNALHAVSEDGAMLELVRLRGSLLGEGWVLFSDRWARETKSLRTVRVREVGRHVRGIFRQFVGLGSEHEIQTTRPIDGWMVGPFSELVHNAYPEVKQLSFPGNQTTLGGFIVELLVALQEVES